MVSENLLGCVRVVEVCVFFWKKVLDEYNQMKEISASCFEWAKKKGLLEWKERDMFVNAVGVSGSAWGCGGLESEAQEEVKQNRESFHSNPR